MATTICANDFRSRHAKRSVGMPLHSTWNAVEIGRPTTAGFELVCGFVQRRIASSAGVDAGFGHVLVIFASEWRFGAFFADDAELFYVKYKYDIHKNGDMGMAG